MFYWIWFRSEDKGRERVPIRPCKVSGEKIHPKGAIFSPEP